MAEAADDLIGEFVNRPKATSDKDFLLKELLEIDAAFTKLSNVKISLGNASGLAGVGDGAKKAKEGVSALDAAVEKLLFTQTEEAKQLAKLNVLTANATTANKDAAKEALGLNKNKSDLEKANEKLLKSYDAEAQQLANVKVQTQLVNKANNDAAKEALGLVGAYDRLNAEYVTAKKAAQDYAAGNEVSAEEMARLNKVAFDLGARLKTIDANVNTFNRNVGNYAGSLGGAFAVLTTELKNVQDKIKSTNQADAGFSNLIKQEKLLSTLTDSLNKGFSSTSTELRAYEKAIKTLGVEVGLGSELFQKLSVEVGEVKDQVNDAQAALKFQSSDTKYLDAAIGAVQGLAGAYGVAQGAAALFGSENEDLQKQMVKLQAVLTIVQSLQSVQNALLVENAAGQGFLAAKTALANLAMSIQTTLLTTQAAIVPVVVEETAALGVAEAEVAVAANAAAVAIATETVVVEAATASTGAFAAAIAVVLGPLVAIGVAAYFVYQKVKDWTAATFLNVKQQKELTEVLTEQVKSLQDIADLQDQAGKKNLDYLKQELDATERNGKNQYEILAIKQKIAEANKNIADAKYTKALSEAEDKYVKQGLIGVDALHKAQSDSFEDLTSKTYTYNKLQQQLQKQLGLTDAERLKAKVSDKDIDHSKEVVDKAKSEQALAQANFDFFSKAEVDRTATENEQTNLRLDIEKLSADERRKLTLAEAQLETSTVENKNSIILANEASTLQERLKAIASTAAAQKRLAEAENQNVQNDNSQTPIEKEIAAKNAAQKISQIERDSSNEQFLLRREYAKKDQLALIEETKIQLETRISADEKIADNDKKSFDERLKALTDSLEARRAILLNQYRVEVDQYGLTADQKKAIDAKYIADTTDATVQFGIKQLALYKVNQEQITAAIEKEAKKREANLTAANNRRVIAVTQDLLKGNISFTEYSQKRARIEAENNIEESLEAVKAQGKIVLNYKEGTEERAEAEKDFTDKVLKYQQSIIDKDDLITNQRLANLQKAKDYGDQVFDVIGGAITASITNQKNALQDQSDQIDKNTQQQIDAVNASVLSEQDKAAKIIVINAKAQAQKDQIAAENRKLDQQKAQADKLKAIFDIILNTAVNITAAKTIPERIFAAAIGAAQLAIAYATPVPKFKKGRVNGERVTGIVGDGGVNEVMYAPDMSRAVVTPDRDTLVDIPEGWGIAPTLDEFRERAFKMAAKPASRMPVITGSDDRVVRMLMQEMQQVRIALGNQQQIHFNWDNGQLELAVQNGINKSIYLNANLG